MYAHTQLFPLSMGGKGSSSCPVLLYWKEISPRRGRSAVFNGLIALEKAATANAVRVEGGGGGGISLGDDIGNRRKSKN